MRTYTKNGFTIHDSELIVALPKNHIFVFGSNLSGRHGAGAAKVAHKNFGATYYVGEGIMNQSYALPTLDRQLNKMSELDLFVHFLKFVHTAIERQDLTFILTKVGCGLAGYENPEKMYWEFIERISEFLSLPSNIVYPSDFIR